MGIARFTGVEKIQGGSMPFESYLKQINLLYPNVADMYIKYATRINEFDSEQIARLIGAEEYELANSFFDGKLNVFASLKENNLELFEAFLEAYGIREKIGEIFDLAAMTLEEMLEVVRELYEEDYDLYLESMDIIKLFEVEEFLRVMVVTEEDILSNNENYLLYEENLFVRLQETLDIVDVLTLDGQIVNLLDSDQLLIFTQRFESLFQYFRKHIQAYTYEIEDQTTNQITFGSRLAYKGSQAMADMGTICDKIYSGYKWDDLNYLDLLSDSTINDFQHYLWNYQSFFSNFTEMRLGMKHLDSRLENYLDPWSVGIETITKDLLGGIVDQLANNPDFVYTENLSNIFKSVIDGTLTQQVELMRYVNELDSYQQDELLKMSAKAVSQHLSVFRTYAEEVNHATGVYVLGDFYSFLSYHFQGYDKWGVVGGMIRHSTPLGFADFITTAMLSLIQSSGSDVFERMAEQYSLKEFFRIIKTRSPQTLVEIKELIEFVENEVIEE